MPFTRREFITHSTGALASAAMGSACAAQSLIQGGDGRLRARPKPGVKTTARGRRPLGLGTGRDGVLAVPASEASLAQPLPLVVLLHGAGGSGDRQLSRFGSAPSDAGVAVLALDSRNATWDAIRGSFSADVEFLDRALDKVFAQVAVDPARLAIGGFSDGATYGLSLGLINGDLFHRIVAFSPGFIIDSEPHDKPRVFVSHGTADDILPIEQCGRPIVNRLRRQNYDVTFREFSGGHEVPPAIAVEGMNWIGAKS